MSLALSHLSTLQGGGMFIPDTDTELLDSGPGNPPHFSSSPDTISVHSDITSSSRSHIEFDSLSVNSAELPLFDDGEITETQNILCMRSASSQPFL